MPIITHVPRDDDDRAPVGSVVVVVDEIAAFHAAGIAIQRLKPQLDPAPLHTCGTLFRAGVITAGCCGCTLAVTR